MQDGDLLDLDITGIAHGGVFVARHEGRVVFVSDAVDGERVRVRLSDTSKSAFWRAETVEVLDASEHRRPHVWAAADIAVAPEARPGGAEFGHIELAHQRVLKQRVLDEALTRFAGIPSPRTTIRPAGVTGGAERPDGLHWRTRVSLHANDDGVTGPFAARSHRVIPVTDLPLATEAIAEAAAGLGGFGPGRIDLVQPADGRVRVIVRTDPARPERHERRGRSPRASRTHRLEDPAAHETVIERVGDLSFRVDAGGFWQVHRLAAQTLSAAVASAIERAGGVDRQAAHLDLYGGVGLFAAVMAQAGATRITSVESDARATEHAGENLAAWVGARAENARTDRYLTRLLAGAGAAERARLARGVILLDPPRAGAGRTVVEQIVQLRPASVVYVACDPVALARDLGTFRTRGYEATQVDAFDLFPHSHHLEAVAVLARG